MLQIGEVANRVGLSLRTMRHWDEVGLVVPSARSQGGFRLYTEADVQRLLFIKTLKPLDLSIEQIRELTTVIDELDGDDGQDPDRTAHLQDRLAMFRAAAEARIEVLHGQLRDLQGFAGHLASLTASHSSDVEGPAGRH
ncbi:MAG: MerR family transcriptional regulator [Pseudonocardia sp.]|nr:MerR family transcriptional regulator [Pseudonocardia sp.]